MPMYMNNNLHRLFHTLPVVCIFGNSADFSRYRYLHQITNVFESKFLYLNRYIRDKINVVVYPERYGSFIYYIKDDNVYQEEDIDSVFKRSIDEIDAIVIPGKYENQNNLIEFPSMCDCEYDFSFSDYLVQMLFFESFPYGKQSFIDMVENAISIYPYSASSRIILYNNNEKYGATDIISEKESIDDVIIRLKRYTQDIQIVTEHFQISQINSLNSQVYSQYKIKKSKIIENRLKMLEDEFEFYYTEAAARFLINEGEGDNGVLSEQAFGTAFKYESVKKANDVERKIIDNYFKLLQNNQIFLYRLLCNIYDSYLNDLIELQERYLKKMAEEFIFGFDKKYKYGRKSRCPETPIEYRKLCNQEKYTIRLKQYVNELFYVIIKEKIYQDIYNKLKSCEVKYV